MVSQAGRMSSASSHSESCSVAILTRRSRVLDRPSGDSRSTTIHSSFEGAASANSRAVEALVLMRSCFNVDLTVMTRQLVEVRKHYYIPSEYKLHVPLLGEHPYDAFLSGFSLSTDALEAGLNCALRELVESEENVSGSDKLWADALGVDVRHLAASPEGAWSDSGGTEAGCRQVGSTEVVLLVTVLSLLGEGGSLGL
ncbi:hypothetical protein GW17_00060013 [Ensete ventricosum]|nr:hypothetical protein GW17_00060013 [Ensete ventricosum]